MLRNESDATTPNEAVVRVVESASVPSHAGAARTAIGITGKQAQ